MEKKSKSIDSYRFSNEAKRTFRKSVLCHLSSNYLVLERDSAELGRIKKSHKEMSNLLLGLWICASCEWGFKKFLRKFIFSLEDEWHEIDVYWNTSLNKSFSWQKIGFDATLPNWKLDEWATMNFLTFSLVSFFTWTYSNIWTLLKAWKKYNRF